MTLTANRPMQAPGRVPARWRKFAHLMPYERNNSLRGIREAARLGYDAIDLDLHSSRDSVFMGTHWDKPLLHGFFDPLRRTSATRTVGSMSCKHLSRLRSRRGNYIIQTAWMLLAQARLSNIRIEWELKMSDQFESVERMMQFKEVCDAFDVECIVKTLSNIPGAAKRLEAAHKAGFKTMILPRGSRRLKKSVYWPIADYVRGPVYWID